ncbi:carbamoyl-phosphate synthase large subunit [Conexibacter woesei]|uniref:Carbamoyl phosphate synthase large chain n=1 Tax=Conexibacter woesei (strain DSM 14684 / CCUG 47730 / CIP 108061 / JCM 11494 / NBRC 100937 / ID131577) TaxID=469383 RepID=D3FE07_CONWI|nr:carbamoyl-phosphate synthase large subunit [Conexibacter woesei]ADB51623.1 carbamoyl-phosphate synthase, large subunit [Conexibacter woesei DSM 14684]
MPKRTDIRKILIIGSGPIVIGQAAEFDYSGTQACKVLMEEGYEVVLVNSNPATIMTDPEIATATYVEPLLPGPVAQVIERERPDALLPTLGGQTALNLAKALHEDGTLTRYDVELIGANYEAIDRAEDRDRFRETMETARLRVPRSAIATTLEEARGALQDIGLPMIIRPAFTLGGRGGGIARTEAEFEAICARGIEASPIDQILIDESVLGWGEFELEVMRDHADNVVIICSIENLDPMGVHTGDSVCVAPQQTLTDKQYQKLRDQAIAVIRAVGVETGGSNVQFAVNPETDEIIVIEMNPRVSRSSALASKATGFPIAKIAARLAVGYTLQEIDNDITRATPASFEPTIDYCVVKWPRFAFEKFPGSDAGLTTHMKSVGEAMAIGRTFKQAFAKALRSRELDSPGVPHDDLEELLLSLEQGGPDRFDLVLEAFRRGVEVETLHARTQIDPWFLRELQELALDPAAAEAGERTFKSVDTCAAEFAARTPYYYSARERPRRSGVVENEVVRGDRASVVILGAGPNRIGQGIEFDYCCVHAAMTVRESGKDAVMVNCNPETVSTDYDTSDRLYFEPLTLEDVLGVCEIEKPEGVIVQFGGQTPLRLAAGLEAAGVPILGTSIDAIDHAEDRGRFGRLLEQLGFSAPPYATAHSPEEALAKAPGVGFPLLVRPSYVLGGRAMEIVYSLDGLQDYLTRVGAAHGSGKEIFLDRFLEDSIEVDVDALCDGTDVWIGGIMQHVEEAGIHSGDSACVLPPHSLGPDALAQIRAHTEGIAKALGVVGLLNVQYAVDKSGQLYVIEANPRASRTVPFVSKAIGLPLAKLACRIMLGEKIADLGLPEDPVGDVVCVKEAVMPFDRFAGADSLLGPEMRSTGEVMGIAHDFPTAFAKAQAAAGSVLPSEGTVFITVTDGDKPAAAGVAMALHGLGFRIVATAGTAQAIKRMGIPVEALEKIGSGSPNVLELIERGEVKLVVNTPVGTGARIDGWEIRSAAIAAGIPCITTMTGAMAAAQAIAAGARGVPAVIALQELQRVGDGSPAAGAPVA